MGTHQMPVMTCHTGVTRTLASKHVTQGSQIAVTQLPTLKYWIVPASNILRERREDLDMRAASEDQSTHTPGKLKEEV